jgi:hypothetical protein
MRPLEDEWKYLVLKYSDSTCKFLSGYNAFIKRVLPEDMESDALIRQDFLLAMENLLKNGNGRETRCESSPDAIFRDLVKKYPVAELVINSGREPLLYRDFGDITLEHLTGMSLDDVSKEARKMFCNALKLKAQKAAAEESCEAVEKIWGEYKTLLAKFGLMAKTEVRRQVRDFPAVWRKKTITEIVNEVPQRDREFFESLINAARKTDEYEMALTLASRAEGCARKGDVGGAQEACARFKRLVESAEKKEIYDVEEVEGFVGRARKIIVMKQATESYVNNEAGLDAVMAEFHSAVPSADMAGLRDKLRNTKLMKLISDAEGYIANCITGAELSDLDVYESLKASAQSAIKDGEPSPLSATLGKFVLKAQVSAYLGIGNNQTLRPEIRQEYLEKAQDRAYHLAEDAAERKDMDSVVEFCTWFRNISRIHMKELVETEESIAEAIAQIKGKLDAEPVAQ